MSKRIMTIFFLLALMAGLYAMTAKADGGAVVVRPTRTAQPSPTLAPTDAPKTCNVITGIEDGTVNLRACPGAMCGAVLDVLTEGERLTILTAGDYVNVTTESGVTGWLNKNYCKGK